MTSGEIIAILSALATVLGAWLENRERRHDREVAALAERVRAVEVRCDRLEVRP